MKKNLPALSALGASVWNAGLSLLAIPVYLSHLGVEAYGVIGVYLALQAILQIFDLGLAPAVNRELARASALGEIGAARTLLHTLGRIYWAATLAIILLFWICAPFLATTWLSTAHLSTDELKQALVLIGLVIAARWPIAVYQNALVGLGRLGIASSISAGMTSVVVGSSVVVVIFVSPSLKAFFITQAIASLTYTLVIRHMAWRVLAGHGDATFDVDALRRIWRFSLGMGGVTLTGIALTQMDKAILSTLLPLASFGEYMLAITANGGLAVLVAPLFSVIFPRFSALVASEQKATLRTLYDKGSRLFAICYFPVVIALGVYSHDVVLLWTHNEGLANRVAPLISLLSVGSGINGIMYFPYTLQLAHGYSNLPFMINTVLLVVLAPLIIFLTLHYGTIGGAAAWPILQIIYLGVGTYVTHRKMDIGSGASWIGQSVILPFLVCGLISAILHPVIARATPGSVLKLAEIGLSVLISPLLCALVFTDLRNRLLAIFRQRHEALEI